MSKKTVFLSLTIVLLVITIVTGVWVFVSSRKTQEPPKSEPKQQTKTFTMSEVAQHSAKEDCWTTISGDVYDLTEFVNRHPGGDEILRACGTDATILFTKRQTQDGQSVGTGTPHSQAASEQLAKLKIGTLSKE